MKNDKYSRADIDVELGEFFSTGILTAPVMIWHACVLRTEFTILGLFARLVFVHFEYRGSNDQMS